MTESPEDRLALSILVLNERMKMLASHNSSMSVAYFSAAAISIPAALLATMITENPSTWKVAGFLAASVCFTCWTAWQGKRSLNAAMANLADMKLPLHERAR